MAWSAAPCIYNRAINYQHESAEGQIPRGWPKVRCPLETCKEQAASSAVLTLLTVLPSESSAIFKRFDKQIHDKMVILKYV